MGEPVIKVEELSKRYRRGAHSELDKTLKERLKDVALAPIRNFRRIRNLTKFDTDDAHTFWALKDVSFEINAGEVVGLIGRNGAGKSTLLKILSRITLPTSGVAKIRGRVGSLLEVGTGFHPELTGRENIYLNGAILGMRRHEIDARFDEIVEFSEVSAFLDTPVKRFSSGMFVRLSFAVAAHLEPEVLIVDEVLAVGDTAFQAKCLGKIGEVTKQGGRTVLFVSHNLAAVNRLCDRAFVLDQGRFIHEGPTQDCINVYLENSGPQQDFQREEFELRDNVPAQLTFVELAGAAAGTAVYQYHEAVGLNIGLKVRELGGYRVSLSVLDVYGHVLFVSADDDITVAPLDDAKPSDYIYDLALPAEFFKPGRYSITLTLYRHLAANRFNELETKRGAASFEVHDTVTRRGQRRGYHQVALVAPSLSWHLTHPPAGS